MDMQQTTTPPSSPMPSEGGGMQPAAGDMKNKWWFWIAIGAIVIGVLAWFLWQGTPSYSPGTATEDQQTNMLSRQSASDDIGAIEADVNTTDLSTLDKELSDIESRL